MGFTIPTVNVLGVEISRLNLSETMDLCLKRIAEKKGGYICFANVHLTTESRSHSALKHALDGSILNAADGVPLRWVSLLKKQGIKSRVCGPDFFQYFLENRKKVSMGFLGAQPENLERITAKFGLDDSACYSPPMRAFSETHALEDWARFLEKSPNRKSPDVVWVGLGAPKQELWMETISKVSPQTLFFGVGAAFDFLSDQKPRAPKWMQKSGLEWVHRLGSEPRRLWKRYLVTNSKFVFFAAADVFGMIPSKKSQ